MASAKKKNPKSTAKANTDHVNIQETNNLFGKLYVCYLKDKVCLLNLKGEKSKGGENHESLKTPLTFFIFRKWLDLKDIWEHALSAHQSLLLRVSDIEHIDIKLKSKTLCWLKI